MKKWDEDFLRKRLGDDWKNYVPPEINQQKYLHNSSNEQSNVEIESYESLIELVDFDELHEKYVNLILENRSDDEEISSLLFDLIEEVYSATEDEVLLGDINERVNFLAKKKSGAFHKPDEE